jgi:hypothetical protein
MQKFRHTCCTRRRLLAACAALAAAAAAPATVLARLREAVLYKSPQCDCCEEYAKILRRHGLAVRTVAVDDLDGVKRREGVPPELAGCHTMLLEGYVVEGHVPVASIQKLLATRPPIRGIALPGMPPGSPGMSGRKRAPFEILEIPRDGALRGAPRLFAVE